MKFITTVHIQGNRPCTVHSPNMLNSHWLIPQTVRIETLGGGNSTPARDIQCKISTSVVELENNQEAFFNVYDEVSLAAHYKALQRTGDLSLVVTNRCPEPRQFRVIVDYCKCEGVLMHQERYDGTYDKVFTNISNVGYCTRLVLSCNRPVSKLTIRPLAECEPEDTEFEWLTTQDVEPCETLDAGSPSGGRPVFIIGDEDMQQLAQYLDFIQLSIVDPLPEEERAKRPLHLSVLAYGFPKK